jgi:predicted nuclease of predicted toxin-antitoxin system
LRFLVDQQLPPAMAAWLREQGFDAKHVREIDL